MRCYRQQLDGFLVASACAIAVACGTTSPGNTTGPSATGGTPTTIVKVSGDSQTVAYDATIPKPLVVKVTDSVGKPVTDTPVSWLTSLFGGPLTQNITMTDATGQTDLAPMLGALPGAFSVTAAINNHSTTFTGSSNVTLATGALNLSAGLIANCGLTPKGAAYCWGNGTSGQLGDGFTGAHTGPVPLSGGQTFKQVSVGDWAACGVTGSGALYCWGDPTYGNFGNGVAPGGPLVTTPTSAGSGRTFSFISVGLSSSCGLSSTIAYCWGSGSSGQLGTGSTANQWAPAKVAVPTGVTFAWIGAGSFGVTCGLSTGGAAYCWGNNYYGALGTGSSSPSEDSVPVAVAGGKVFTALAVGSLGVCGLTAAGIVYCWGQAVNGNGTSGAEYTPTAIQQSGLTFTQLSMDGAHACALATTGTAYCWGDNDGGDLGSGSYATTGATPVAVTGGLTFNTILAGGASTCAYSTTNVMYCWGGNQAQQLGLSAAADSEYATPVPVPGITGG